MKILIGALLMTASMFVNAQINNTTISKPQGTELSDGQVAKVLMTINEGEIDAAKLAQTKSKNQEVKNFASTMAAQHKENALASQKIVTANKMDAKESDLSKTLKTDAKTENQKIAKAAAGAFDKAYLDEQIKMHEKALQTLNDVLLPAAKNGDLHSHLENTRVAVSEHLEHAKTLAAKIQ